MVFAILATSLAAGTALVLAACGELLAERTGVLNLGLEGTMAIGAVVAIVTVASQPNAYLGLAAALVAGLVMGAVLALATVVFRASQILVGLAMTFIGIGLAGRIGVSFAGQPAPVRLSRIPIPGLSDIPLIGPVVFDQTLVAYLAYFVLPPLIAFILYRTRHGLNLRAVGEDPAAADASGVSVVGFRFAYVCAGNALAALGGAYLTLSFTPGWSEGVTAGRGWIAIALVIFASWRPERVVLGAIFFGVILSLGFLVQGRGWAISPSFLSTLPYIGTILLLVVPSFLQAREKRKVSATPASLGLPFWREST